MANIAETNVRQHVLVSLYVQDERLPIEIKKKADSCGVCGTVQFSQKKKLEIILEGELLATSKVITWLLRKPRLGNITRLESDVEPFLNEFEGRGFQTV